MSHQRITSTRILAVSLFSISCFLLLLVLWLRSGGTVPLKPAKYQVHLQLPQAKGLGPHSDVRVSGVTVGHVISIKAAQPLQKARADVLIDLERPFVPLRADARAMLRGKSILGEAYVALSLGSAGAPQVPDGGTLPAANADLAVEPDQIFESFDPRTQKALQTWQNTEGPAVARHGYELNHGVRSLRPWMVDAGGLLRIVEQQGDAVRHLLSDGGEIADGLGARAAALQLLARSGDRAFNATGRQGESLAKAFREIPSFQRETARTLSELRTFSQENADDVAALREQLASLSPALEALAADAPELRAIVGATPPLSQAGRRGLPRLNSVLDELPPMLQELDPFLRRLNPALRYLAGGRGELMTVLANLAAATHGAVATPHGKEPLHYIRANLVLNPAALGPLSSRPGVTRTNAYPDPAQLDLLAGYPSFETRHCGNPTPYITEEPSPNLTEEQRGQVREFVYDNKPPDEVPRPGCTAQPRGYQRLSPDPPAHMRK